MDIELKQFRNGRPVMGGGDKTDLQVTIIELEKDKKYEKILQLAQNMDESKEKYRVLANAYLHLRNWKKLVETCEIGLKLAEDSQFYHLKGKALGKLGDNKKQIEYINRAIAINPHVPAYHRNLGAGYYNAKQYQKAIEQHTKAIGLEPENPINYHNTGSSYFRLKDYKQAKGYFDEAIQRSPTLALSYAWKGDCLKEENLLKEALWCYEKAYGLSNNALYLKEKEKLTEILQRNKG